MYFYLVDSFPKVLADLFSASQDKQVFSQSPRVHEYTGYIHMRLNCDKLTPVLYTVSSVNYLWSKALFIDMNNGNDRLAFCLPIFFLVLLISIRNIRTTSGNLTLWKESKLRIVMIQPENCQCE